MKKFISALLSCTMLISAAPVFAENNTEETEKILVSVKERIGDTEKYKEFSSNSYSSKTGTIYNFNWNTSSDEEYSSLDVSCNSEGVITSYNIYDSSYETDGSKLSINRAKRADALKKAKEELNKLNPDVAGNLVISDTSIYESFRSDNYHFRIQRYENGIPVLSDTGRITLDTNCNLKSFNISYTTGFSFENSENTISKEDAISSYNEKIGTDLCYMMSHENSDEPTIKLVYSPKNDNRYINAVTGEATEITPDYDIFLSNKENMAADSALSQDSGGSSSYRESMSEAELKNITELEGLLSKEDADNIAKSCKYFGIGSSAKINSSSLYYDELLKTYIYRFSYRDGEDNTGVNINAKNGDILYFYRWGDIPSDTKPDTEKISKLSDEIINDLAKDKAKEYKKNEENSDASYYTYYTRYVNDIPFNANSVNLRFDHEYNLTMYSISYYDMTFPAPENILSGEDAFKALSDIGDYKIFYIADYDNKKYIPVYNLAESITIDAFTGKSIYEYEENTESGGKYTDIEGHYAEDKIKALAEYGIFLDGAELRPDEPITQKDYVALLSIVFYYNDISCLRSSYSAENLYRTLPNNFLEKDINPASHLTRCDAAKLMVKAMGAEEYAKLSQIYAPLYNDVYENIGYINILTGFGVLSGDGSGNFNPNNEITRAQALIMIYNYLSR